MSIVGGERCVELTGSAGFCGTAVALGLVWMTRLGPFIRENKQRILDEWQNAGSRLPSAHGLGPTAIRDHMPELLDTLAEAIERNDASALPMKGLPNLHAACEYAKATIFVRSSPSTGRFDASSTSCIPSPEPSMPNSCRRCRH